MLYSNFWWANRLLLEEIFFLTYFRKIRILWPKIVKKSVIFKPFLSSYTKGCENINFLVLEYISPAKTRKTNPYIKYYRLKWRGVNVSQRLLYRGFQLRDIKVNDIITISSNFMNMSLYYYSRIIFIYFRFSGEFGKWLLCPFGLSCLRNVPYLARINLMHRVFHIFPIAVFCRFRRLILIDLR